MINTRCLHSLLLIPLACLSLSAVEDTNFNQSSTYLASIRAMQSDEWTGNIGIFGGFRRVFADEWAGVEKQPNLGVMVDFGKKGWLANIAIDYHSSSESGDQGITPISGDISELDIGLRMYIDDPVINWKAYIGGGVAFIDDQIDLGGTRTSGSEIGFWINSGLYYRFKQKWNIGIDLRHSAVIANLEDNENLRPNNYTYGLMLGYHW